VATVVIAVLLVLTVIGSITPTASAATPTTTANTSDKPDRPVVIDNRTTLVDSSYDADNQTVTLTVKSERLQAITFVDAGGFAERGPVNRRSVQFTPGQERTVRLDVTQTDTGYVGVSISTDAVLYSLPISTDSQLIGGNWTYRDAQVVAICIGTGTALITLLILIRSHYDLDVGPERLA